MKKNRANAEPGGEAKHQQCLTLSARKIKRVKAMVKAHKRRGPLGGGRLFPI